MKRYLLALAMGMAGLSSFLFTGSNLNAAPQEVTTGDDDFDYYYGEFLNYQETDTSEDGHKLGNLIMDRLSDTIFNTSDEAVFKRRLLLLKRAFNDYPQIRLRFQALDNRLQLSFGERMKVAKHKRWIYTVAGAAIGAVVAIPAGKLIASSASWVKILTIGIPVGALAGGGAGYLLGSLLVMPGYTYAAGELSRDLEMAQQAIDANQ